MAEPEKNTQHPEGPLIVFVNKKSGGQQGTKLAEKLKKYVPEENIYDLSEGGPTAGLTAYKDVFPFRVLVCGGDGSVGWVLAYLDKLGFAPEKFPSIAVLPLGTGNDLSRSLGWGGGYTGEKIKPILDKLDEASTVNMDRWVINIKPKDGEEKTVIMNNYFSVGIDAQIAYEFHTKREANPAAFKSRTLNKAKYLKYGVTKFKLHGHPLSEFVEASLDDEAVELPESTRGLVGLNLPSYSAGANLWGPYSSKDNFVPLAIDDGKFELCGLKGAWHAGRVGGKTAHGKRLGQGSELKLSLTKEAHVQVDGEPWLQAPCELTLKRLNQARMCVSQKVARKEKFFHGTPSDRNGLKRTLDDLEPRDAPNYKKQSFNVESLDAFQKLVKENGKKEMNREEFKKVMKEAGFEAPQGEDDLDIVEHIFNVFDKDETGLIEPNEYAACLNALVAGSFDQKLKAGFEAYDVDQSGDISRDEMANMCYVVALMMYEETPELQEVIRDFVDETFEIYDLDKDDRLSFDEVYKAAKDDTSIAKFFTGNSHSEKIKKKKKKSNTSSNSENEKKKEKINNESEEDSGSKKKKKKENHKMMMNLYQYLPIQYQKNQKKKRKKVLLKKNSKTMKKKKKKF